MVAEVAVMAKKKSGPKPMDGVGRVAVITVRSTPAWKAWVEGLAEHCRSTSSDTIDRALVELARGVNYKTAPPKR